MNTEMHKRALAAREAHLALLDLKKVVDDATQTTHAAGIGSRSLGDTVALDRRNMHIIARCSGTSRFGELRGYVE